jgi:phosphatidylglycerophosphatase A
MNSLVRALATLGPVGYLPVAPATWASAVVALVAWFLPVPALPAALAAIAVGAALAVWLCGEAEKSLGHDAHPIVLDELIGQSIALIAVPHAWPAFVASFALFRLFDIWKPLGARQAQELPGGLGIVADDVVAGLVSCGVLQLGLWGGRALGWWR